MNRARAFTGVMFVVGGTLLLLDVAGVVDAGSVMTGYWPLVIIALAGLTWWDDREHWVGPAVAALVGVALLVETTDIVSIDLWSVIWPAVIIAIGLRLILRRRPSRESADRVDAFVAFGGTELASHSASFTGGTVGSLFGGAEIDLRDSSPAPGAQLDVFTAFGGTEISVPEGWRVTVHGLPLFGGIENVTIHEALSEDAPTLDVHATVLFGGVEVKH